MTNNRDKVTTTINTRKVRAPSPATVPLLRTQPVVTYVRINKLLGANLPRRDRNSMLRMYAHLENTLKIGRKNRRQPISKTKCLRRRMPSVLVLNNYLISFSRLAIRRWYLQSRKDRFTVNLWGKTKLPSRR